jgi:hypothetical protein
LTPAGGLELEAANPLQRPVLECCVTPPSYPETQHTHPFSARCPGHFKLLATPPGVRRPPPALRETATVRIKRRPLLRLHDRPRRGAEGGGADEPENMQWQTKEAATEKWEQRQNHAGLRNVLLAASTYQRQMGRRR